MGKEGCLCGWKGIGCVGNVPSDSHQGLLTENTRRFCNGCLYFLSYLSTSVSPCPRAMVMEGDTGPRSCDPSVLLELPIPRKELANCTAAGMAEFLILTLPAGPVTRGLAETWSWNALHLNPSHSSQGCQWPFKTFVPQLPTCNPWITALTFLKKHHKAEVPTSAKS